MVTPRQRPTVSECFHHPWIAQHSEPPSPSPLMLKVNIILFHQNSKSPSKSPDSRPGSICAEAQCPLPHRPWVAKVLSDMQVIVAMANNIIIIIITTIAVMNTLQPALAPAGLVRLAGDHQACVQHLFHHFNPHQAPPHDDQNQGQVEPPPPPPAGQAHREEALLVKVKRGNFREGQKCNHTFLRRLGVFTFVAIVTSNITFFITMSRLPIPT